MKQAKAPAAAAAKPVVKTSANSTWKRVLKMKEFYFIMLIPIIMMIVFDYGPMYGVVIAFKNFKIKKGILGSDWVGFENFIKFFKNIFFWRIIGNTFRIAFFRITICTICPIVFALLINEIASNKFKRVVQTISYLPHFMSWVVIATFVNQILSPEYGLLNAIIEQFGGETYYFLGDPSMFTTILITAMVWQGTGWGSITYLACIAGIDTAMYEAAEIDGANRFQRVWYITLPSIVPMITILFILSLRSILSAGFDPVYNLQNALNMSKSMTIETYTFEEGLYNAKYAYSAAVGLFQTAIGLFFLLVSNAIVKKINDQGIF